MKKLLLTFAVTSTILSTLVGCGQQVAERQTKDQLSAEHGLNRTLEVYSHDGKLIKKYEGQFDIETSTEGGKIKFDIDGKRHIVYNAIVVTDEK